MLIVERSFIGFNGDGVLALRPSHGGDLLAADCPASMLPRVGAVVTHAQMRAWAAALSGAETPSRVTGGDPPRWSRVLSSDPQPGEVKHQGTKTRELAGNIGSQATLTTIPIRGAYGCDRLPGVILG